MWSDWKIYERGGIVFAALEPHMAFGKKTSGAEFYHVSGFFAGTKGDHLYWLYAQPGYQRDSIRWIKRWLAEGMHGRYFKVAAKRYQVCHKFLQSVLDKPVPPKTVELLQYCNEINKLLLLHTCTVGVSIDAFDDYFPEVFREALKRAGLGHIVQNKEAWAVLQQAAYRSVVMDYKLALLILAQKARRSNLRQVGDWISRIQQKYFWLTMGWSGTLPIGKPDISKELKKYTKLRTPDYHKMRQELVGYAQKIEHARVKIIKKFKIPPHVVQPYLNLLDAVARLHDERKEIQMRTLHELNKIRAAVAKAHRLNVKDIEWLKITELMQLIKTGKMPYKIVSQRKAGYCIKYARGKFVFEKQGKEAIVVIDKEISLPLENRNEVKGVIAARGIARGHAVVTDDAKIAAKIIKPGDIIIASMTTPDFVPAMKKAGAIVTNEGGVTAHAAIVSRELGIPCITGTIHATHIFQTGDMVEVDANKGVVKKL